MASGKKNYFRHSFFARNDMKLLELRDEIGIGFYFYFFTLLELCGEQSAEELRDNYEFHDSTIRSLWSVNLKKGVHVASVMHAVGLLEFKKLEKSFWFKVPNLSKYMGKYTNKIPSKSLIKEKEIKLNERKVKGTPSLGLCAGLSEPEMMLLVGKYGEALVQGSVEKDFNYYQKNPMRKSFFDFFSDSLSRKSQWVSGDTEKKKKELDDIDETINAVFERMEK